MEALLAQFKNAMPEPLWNALVILGTIGTAIWMVIRSFVIINQGQVGVRKRFGKTILSYRKFDPLTERRYTKAEIKAFKAFDDAEIKAFRPARYGRPKYMYPGFNPLIPVVHSVVLINIGINNIRLGNQRIVNPESYVAHDMSEISVDIRISDAYLWMISSIDAEAQVKAVIDTQLSLILRQFTIEEILDMDLTILRALVLNTMFSLAPVGAAIELDRGGLNLGTYQLSIDASFNAQSRRELAQAVRATGSSGMKAVADDS
ncbi:MAG TPA: hypothetical protein VGO98_02700 [Candidatus Saccharimonadales bacterium]|jgi:regulator of protease activity HflC (stomatin/prohibitin superfamily)|nr:hypothetical protein [Candidatus Saccharimonadales bacterium]